MIDLTKEKGITLIALVITVIILLILASVALSLITGQNGLFARANQAGYEYSDSAGKEAGMISGLNSYLDQYMPEETSGGNGGTSQPVNPTPTLYTITYHANTGSGTMDATTGETVTVASNGFTAPANKAFRCWNTSADGTGTRYDVGANESQNLTQNLDLYAQWYQNVYEVGDIVTYRGESFYVIEDSTVSDSTVRLITAQNVDTTDMDRIVQSPDANTVAFGDGWWYHNDGGFSDILNDGYTAYDGEHCDLTEDTYGDALYAAYEYGRQIGAERGTLLTYREALGLENSHIDILCSGTGEYANGQFDSLQYWIGTAFFLSGEEWGWVCEWSWEAPGSLGLWESMRFPYDQSCGLGVRPVVTILKSKI